MDVKLESKDLVQCFNEMKNIICDQKDYITKLDATTGDGDHWANLYMGFEKICEMSESLQAMDISSMLKKVGMTMFSAIGGSSGALYGSGYVAASKAVKDIEVLDIDGLYKMYDAMIKAIMERGKTQPGMKTMVDSLHTALMAYKVELDNAKSDEEIIRAFIEGANNGANNTLDMEAVKGRASYRTDKGVGHLDPGAVTMAIQLECLGNYILGK